jgi:abortive infection bacteriophage resistance protein
MNNNQNTFEKPPLSIDAQLERLNSRGIVIQDRNAARHYLSYISYYRFCGYAIEFEGELVNGEKQYRSGTTFEQVLDCYVFDRKLRLLVVDAIERVEIAIRTVMINELALKYNDAHWYLSKNLFLPTQIATNQNKIYTFFAIITILSQDDVFMQKYMIKTKRLRLHPFQQSDFGSIRNR